MFSQTSYAFNYLTFGMISTPNDQLQFVSQPDLLGEDPVSDVVTRGGDVVTRGGDERRLRSPPCVHPPPLSFFVQVNALLSAIQFSMTPLPPKPSIHEVILGIYSPPNKVDAASGSFGGQTINIKTTNGVVTNTFMTAISVINGGVECGNTLNAPQAQARTGYYVAWLALLGASMTPDEAASLFSPAGTNTPAFCTIANGSPFEKPGIGSVVRMLLGLDCNPNPWFNSNCLRTYDTKTGTITGCVLQGQMDSKWNELTFGKAFGQAACQSGPMKGCCCGPSSIQDPNVRPPNPEGCTSGVKVCACCKVATPLLASNPEAITLCKELVSNLTWYPRTQ